MTKTSQKENSGSASPVLSPQIVHIDTIGTNPKRSGYQQIWLERTAGEKGAMAEAGTSQPCLRSSAPCLVEQVKMKRN